MVARNSNKNTQYFRLILLIFVLTITFLQFNSLRVQASTNQNLSIPSNWSGCNEGPTGNINNQFTAQSGQVIDGFWQALLGMQVNEIKNFVVPSPTEYLDHPELGGKDLYYIVRIDQITPSTSTVVANSQVLTTYSLYVDCTVTTGGQTETTSSSVLPTTSTPSPDNTVPLLAGLGVIVIGLSVFGYFAIIKPRAEPPQDTKITEEKQAKKQMNQTKELLNLIQDKKETTKVKKPDVNLTKQKSSKRPRRR